MKKTITVFLLSFLIVGCSEKSEQGSNSEFTEAASQALKPADTELAAIYDRSCRNCHAIEATGAPLTGDVNGWAPRMEKGMDAMLESIVSGSGGMPPYGMCMDCDVEQFESLINFMATGK